MVASAVSVIKRAGHVEPYDDTKLHASIHHACLSVSALDGEAELFAHRVTRAITAWAADKPEVTSRDLHIRAAALLTALHADAAYAYDIHDATL